MNTLRVRVQTYDDTIAEVEARAAMAAAGRAVEDRSTFTFDNWSVLVKTLSATRMEIIRAMSGRGAMSVREIARRVGRDVKNVHGDLDALAKSGLVDKGDSGFEFPFDRIHVEVDIEAAA
ncbi:MULTISPECIES: helix-turn-helix domain-containing protein [Brucella/Ochrobactrum group]|jgi:predicted transcriptional regulator|uniref:HVO_A0114 family putative DNA-binding protein n=1 Tax=Ochrobactrum sp. BTU2 TaxID=2856166 RepID=UPI00211A5B9B|nr:helix-turn-helix domain-containing protein [Ochrobactrum sp. BTU2]MCQ9146097.1 helix-turn-helix domain-containing protein [Ochrobactrum sp. BTU2]